MTLYKHNTSGNYYRLLISRLNSVNTYLLVNSKNIPIIKSVGWSYTEKEVYAIIIGFDKLTKC